MSLSVLSNCADLTFKSWACAPLLIYLHLKESCCGFCLIIVWCFVLTDEQGIFLVQKMPGPLSQSDAGSSEENAHLAIHNIIKDEVNMAFEKMLDDLNLSEEKKEPLRLQSVIRKKEMLAMHVKGAAQVTN